VPGVTCSECGAGTDVSFRRGTRLADVECPGCGAKALHLRSAGQPNRHRGKQYERCARCGKKGLHHTRPGFTWIPRYGTVDVGPFPAGSPACWSCEPVPAARTDHGLVLHSVEARLGKHDIWNWPDDNAHAVLEAAAKRIPATCPVCISVGWRDGQFHTQAYPVRERVGVAGVMLAVRSHGPARRDDRPGDRRPGSGAARRGQPPGSALRRGPS
jgi:hypothetical protein